MVVRSIAEKFPPRHTPAEREEDFAKFGGGIGAGCVSAVAGAHVVYFGLEGLVAVDFEFAANDA